jgi:hypothetical protein
MDGTGMEPALLSTLQDIADPEETLAAHGFPLLPVDCDK